MRLLLCLILCLLPLMVSAADVILAWDAPINPDGTAQPVDGYQIFYRFVNESGPFHFLIDVGNTLTATVQQDPGDCAYMVRAYSGKAPSGFSNIVNVRVKNSVPLNLRQKKKE